MMKTPRVAVQDNRIDFQLTRSAAYDALLAAVMEDLSAATRGSRSRAF